MKYVIYQMVVIPHLSETVAENYGESRVVYRQVLEEMTLETPSFQSTHDTMELAVEHIKEHGEHLKYMDFTILPVFSIDENGKMAD